MVADGDCRGHSGSDGGAGVDALTDVSRNAIGSLEWVAIYSLSPI